MAKSGQIIIPYGDAPDTPPAGKITIYSKIDGEIYYKTDDGLEHLFATASGVTDHGALSGLVDDDHTLYHTDARGDIRYYTQEQVNTISGALQSEIDGIIVGATTYLELTDTDDAYGPAGYHVITTGSGLSFNKDAIEGQVFVSPSYNGPELGTATHPFSTIANAAQYMYATYSGINDFVALMLLPGIHYIPTLMYTSFPSTKAIIGVDSKATFVRPDPSLAGGPCFGTFRPTTIKNLTLDGSYNSIFRTTPGTIGYQILEESGVQMDILDVNIQGFYNALDISSTSDVYLKGVGISNVYNGITVGSGAVLDADLVYIHDCANRCVHAYGTAEVYLEGCELYTWNSETAEGTGVYAEDEAYVELFGGTNFWGLEKNLHVQDNASIRVDSCVLEPSSTSPGIEQLGSSTLTILNSRAPLSVTDISIADPTNVYINSYDSTSGLLVIGNSSNTAQDIFSINTGKAQDPVFRYLPGHNVDYNALNFHNPSVGENTEIFVSATNAKAALGIHPTGSTAFSSTASVGLVSIQDDVRSGWNIIKQAGTTPTLDFISKNGNTATRMNYDGTIQLNTGVSVNKVLDEDDMASNDPKALVTQQSVVQFVSDSVGDYLDLNTFNTYSGTANDKYLHIDGSKELSSDWDAGNYNITAGGFTKDNTQVDLASFANITGILTGGNLTINTDPTKLDVAAGTSIYVDQTDRNNPVVEMLSWSDQTIDSTLSGTRSKWVGAYRTGPGTAGLVTDTDFTQLEKRSVAVIGRYWGNGDDTITGKGNYSFSAFSFGKSMEDLSYAIGSINISGNVFSISSISGTLDRSAGQSLRFAGNYSANNISPNIMDSNGQTSIDLYQYHIQGATSTILESTVDCDNYDNLGVKTSVPAGKWTVQRIYYFPGSSNIHVVYDTNYYSTMTLAYDSVSSDKVVLNDSILAGSILRAYLIVKQGCTDLTDTDQARIFTAYSDPGLLPGFSDHGDLGGLGNDNHLQYLTLERGDTYYPRTSYIEQSENILYDNQTFAPTDHNNVKDYLDHVGHAIVWDGITARTYPEEVLTYGAFNTLTVLSGVAHIMDIDSEVVYHVTWSGTNINTSSMYQGNNWVYVDTNGDINISQSEPNYYSGAVLGYVYTAGLAKAIGVIHNSGIFGRGFGTRVGEALNSLGPYVADSLTVSLDTNPMRVICSAGSIQHSLIKSNISEMSSDDAGHQYGSFLCWYRTGTSNWLVDYDFAYREDGQIPLRWNDTTQSGFISLGVNGTAVSGSTTITSTTDLTLSIEPYDFIQVGYAGYTYSTLVSGVSWTGSQTNIDLMYPYEGSSTTDTIYLTKAVRSIDSGKYVKHRLLRTTDGQMHLIYGTVLFDNEIMAVAGNLPQIPTAIEQNSVNLAAFVVSSGTNSLVGNIYDTRPLPFAVASSAGSGGGNTVSNHGGLAGLDEDDHTQYVLANGSRSFNSIVSYNGNKSFGSDNQIVSKKYVDTVVVTDHGSLSGRGDDDHSQYSLVAGTRAYTGIVSYDVAKTFTTDAQIVDKKYVDDKVVTDHGALSGRADDDHTQYILVAGTRVFTGKQSYSTHPAFISDTEIVDKKYVDDKQFDHGGQAGLSDDDHPQYLTTARGDINYYTKAQSDTNLANHRAITSTDHDNRYFTESEVNSLLTTLSGSMQNQLDSHGVGTSYYVESDLESSTTSTTFQTKTTITFGSGVTGTYRIAYTMEFQSQAANKDVHVRCRNATDAVDVGFVTQQTNSSSNWFTFTGFKWVNFTGSNKTFVLQFAAGSANCSVRNARIEAWRRA